MKSRLQLIGTAFGLLAVQQALTMISPDWARPDVILAFALALGLRARGTEALVLAFATGYAVDALSAAPLGLHALLCGTGAALTRLADRALYLRAPLPWAIYVTGYGLANAVALQMLLGAAGLPWADVLLRAPGGCLLTALLAVPLFLLLQRIEGDGVREEAWPSLASPGSRL